MKNNNIFRTLFWATVLTICSISNLFSQIQTVALPDEGFEGRIKKAVDEIWIIDTHEHLMFEEKMLEQKQAEELDFIHLFKHYLQDDLISAGYTPQIQQLVNNRNLPVKDRWEIFEPFWKATCNTGYARVAIIVARDLYGIDAFNTGTIEELSKRINDSCQPGWYQKVLKDHAKIDLSIVDVGHIKPDHEFYYHVERFDNFIFVHSASEIEDLGEKYGIEIKSLEDYVAALGKAFQEGLDYGMIAVKNALAYNRKIQYENSSETEAEAVFNLLFNGNNNRPVHFEEVKPLQDYIMHRVLDLARKHDLPVQIHTGLHAGGKNEIRNSKPTHLTNLFNEYPDVEFVIMHSSYPYGAELSVLAKNYPNVFIDMCWTQVISPYYSERYLHEWLETVPANKIMAFGGDYSPVELAYGHSVMARAVIAKVLTEKVEGGYISEHEAIDMANRLLRDNALEIFKLKGRSHDLISKISISIPGLAQDLLKVVKSGSGLIKDWMVIGPFPLGTNEFSDEVAPPGFDQVYPPEKEIDFNSSYDLNGGEIRWQRVKADRSGRLDFKSLFPRGKAIVYAYTEIACPDKRKMKFTFGSDDGAKIWINGKLVYNVHAWRGLGWDGDIIEVDLKKGKNSILIKVEDKWYDWALMMRMMDLNNEIEVVKW